MLSGDGVTATTAGGGGAIGLSPAAEGEVDEAGDDFL